MVLAENSDSQDTVRWGSDVGEVMYSSKKDVLSELGDVHSELGMPDR